MQNFYNKDEIDGMYVYYMNLKQNLLTNRDDEKSNISLGSLISDLMMYDSFTKITLKNDQIYYDDTLFANLTDEQLNDFFNELEHVINVAYNEAEAM